jgi:CheY-specific phosphatase CheX
VTDIAIRQALRDSVNEVLEKMFFVQTLGEFSIPEDAVSPPEDEIAVRVTFQGEPAGSLMLRLTSAAARQIAADFLGTDEAEVSDIQTCEVVLELANMICGSVLSRVESAKAFHLAAPQIVPLSEENTGNLWNTRYAVELSNGRLSVNIATEFPTCFQPAESAY